MAIEITLPYRSDWREMSKVLDYCKGKGSDRSSLEARFGAGESLRETLNALEQLGLIERSDSGDARLTARGEALAYAPDQAQLRDRLVGAMLAYPPYRFPLERALESQPTILDGPWVEHIWQVDMRLGQPRNRVEEARTFFYRLADEAGLGTYRRGVRGQTTRLELASDFASRLGSIADRQGAASATTTSHRNEPLPAGSSGQPVGAATRIDSIASRPDSAEQGGGDATGFRTDPAMAPARQVSMAGSDPALPGLPSGISIQVDMSEWDLDRIERFLRLIGYLPLAPREGARD